MSARPTSSVSLNDAELDAWRQRGEVFDYLGFDVFYVTEGTGEPLLLVQGYPFSSFDWIRVWSRLTERFTVIAPDMLGMGFSDKPSRYRYSVHDHADMHEALLDHLGIRRCHVMPHDIGVSVTQEMLARHEERDPAERNLDLLSIAWLNGGMFNDAYAPRWVQKLLSDTPLGPLWARLPRRVNRMLMESAMRELFGPNTQPTKHQLDQFDEILNYNNGTAVSYKVGYFIHDRYDHRNRWVRAMRETSVPMRYIVGPADPNSGAHMAKRYREVISDPDVVELGAEIAHWPQLEDPDRVIEHFLAFVKARASVS